MEDLRAATALTDQMRVSFAPQDEIRESLTLMRANSLSVVDSVQAVSNMLASATESIRPFVEQMERDRQQFRSLSAVDLLRPRDSDPPAAGA